MYEAQILQLESRIKIVERGWCLSLRESDGFLFAISATKEFNGCRKFGNPVSQTAILATDMRMQIPIYYASRRNNVRDRSDSAIRIKLKWWEKGRIIHVEGEEGPEAGIYTITSFILQAQL